MSLSVIDSILLGIVQGLTEFLPISSSGHLVLTKQLLALESVPITFDILFHLATLYSILTYFRKEIISLFNGFFSGLASIKYSSIGETYQSNSDFRLSVLLILGTVPAVIAGFTLKNTLERLFNDPSFVAMSLIVTGIVLLTTRFARPEQEEVSLRSSILIGIAQAFALIPGVSRAGMTISAGLWRGIDPKKAAQFSFFLAIPAIAGAAVLEVSSLSLQFFIEESITLISGGIAAYVTGLIAIHLLMKLLSGGKFFWFGIYCLSLGAIYLTLF